MKGWSRKRRSLMSACKKYQYVLMQTNNIVIDWDTQKDEAVFPETGPMILIIPWKSRGFTRWIQTSVILEGGTASGAD